MLLLLTLFVLANSLEIPSESKLQSLEDTSSNNVAKIVATSKDGTFFLLQGTGNDMNWMKAEIHCQNNGGHLASIHNDNENLVVGELCGSADSHGRCWIGGIIDAYRVFYWIDLSKDNYEVWYPGQPDNNNGDEYCVNLYTGGEPYPFYKFNDAQCHGAHPYAVCRKIGL